MRRIVETYRDPDEVNRQAAEKLEAAGLKTATV